jgi:hypothetical protein
VAAVTMATEEEAEDQAAIPTLRRLPEIQTIKNFVIAGSPVSCRGRIDPN